MANWFEKIKKYYDAGLWTEKMVGNAVVKKKITVEQYKEITGEDYNKYFNPRSREGSDAERDR